MQATVSSDNLNEVFEDVRRDVHTFARQVADVHAQRAKVLMREEAPKRTGLLANTLELEKTDDPDGFGRIVRPTQRYAQYVEEGTGLYGPQRRRIVPRLKKALRWLSAAGKPIFARSVAGQRPNPFVERAWQRLLRESQTLIDRLVERL